MSWLDSEIFESCISCGKILTNLFAEMKLLYFCNSLNNKKASVFSGPKHHPEFFKDASHLNDDGAHVYTAMFFEELKPYLTLIK